MHSLRRAALLVAICLLPFTASASTECAWVLWSDVASSLSDDKYFKEFGRAAQGVPDVDAVDDRLTEITEKQAHGTSGDHLKLIRKKGLFGPDKIEICEEINRGRNSFLYWKPGRFEVPKYRGVDVKDPEGLNRCFKDVEMDVLALQREQRTILAERAHRGCAVLVR